VKTTKPLGLRLFALLAVFAMIVAACTDGDTTDTTADGDDGATTTQGTDDGTTDTTMGGEDDGDGGPAVEGGTFNIGFISNITTDNWWAALDTLSSTYNQAFLGNGKTSLFTFSLPGFVYIPGIASTDEPVAAVEEGDVWVVEQPIRDDYTWSDGEPVTANDLAFYFDTVREFNLGSNHAASFPPSVLSVTAPDDYTVRVEFDSEPGLAVWQNGVGFAPFVPSHFWQEHVDAARAAAEAVASSLTDEEAVQALVDASLEDEDPENDLTAEDVTQEMIDQWKADAVANEGLTVLYAVESPQEPSVGSQIFDQWETGAFAATVSNASYPDAGATNTLYSDGSFAITPEGGETTVYGGEGAGDVVAEYREGPFVSEILWVEHGTKDAAYEKLAGGELDYVYDPTGITSGLRNELASNPDLEFAVNQTEGFRYLAFNMRKAPMSDLAFRQAVATVTNKELVAETVLAGAVFPGYTVVHPDLGEHYNEDVPRAGWRDGEPMSEADRYLEAVQILTDAGYTWDVEPTIDPENADPVTSPGEGLTMPNGTAVPELTILAPGPGYDPFRATFAIWMETWMTDLGIPVRAEPTDFNAIVAATFPPQTEETALAWDMYMLGWGGGDVTLPGTSSVAFFHSREDAVTGGGFNTPGYNSEEFDATADAFEAATTIGEAAELTKEMEAILARDLPYIVLFRTPIIEAFNATTQFPTDTIMGGHSGFANGWPNAVSVSE
jgi:peptide/nickel transport system substrate-binding protein